MKAVKSWKTVENGCKRMKTVESWKRVKKVKTVKTVKNSFNRLLKVENGQKQLKRVVNGQNGWTRMKTVSKRVKASENGLKWLKTDGIGWKMKLVDHC